MERRVVPKKRIGSFYSDRGRSMRMRQDKGRHKTLDAAEGSTYGDMSVSLCGIPLEPTEAFRFLPLTALVPHRETLAFQQALLSAAFKDLSLPLTCRMRIDIPMSS